MKFKTIFLIFNAVVLVSFLFVFFAPMIMLDATYAMTFLARNWFLGLSFLAILGALNIFFIRNWKLFGLLENEDWPALAHYLSGQINEKGRISNRNVKVYVNSLLLLSDLEGIEKLESLLCAKKPGILERNALLFGVTKLLKGDYRAAQLFLSGYIGKKSCDDPDWLAFDLAFSNLVLKDWQAALPLLEPLAGKRDLVLRGLSGFYLDVLSTRMQGPQAERATSAAAGIKAGILKRHKRKAWDSKAEQAREDIKGVVLSKMIDDAAAWIYGANDEDRQ
jgi:hypothetical protein